MMDVARATGVSHQTVSRVINRPDSVRPATRERVLAAIKELGYRPNLAARALVTDSTRMIGVVSGRSSYFGPASTTAAIELAARGAGYGTLVTSLREGDDSEVDEVLGFLATRGVDGIIVVAPSIGIADAARAAARTAPMVVVADGFEPSARLHAVCVDQELGAKMAVRHLIGAGRRRIAHIAGPSDWFDAQARVRGWRTAMEDAGLDASELYWGDWTAESGYTLGTEILVRLEREPLDALFCSNDLMALGVLAAARDQGVPVPERLAVVGYDDTAGAEYYAPPLTTVSQPFEEMGRLCVEVLLRAIAGEAGVRHSVPPTLKVRRSSSL
ncbi:LacI family DNA-binding transcriptional regulator [Actinomyces faecalis]|nr:LacI family DNA-binding transcriptional regulator [Actinomyces faecalis]